MKRNTFCILVTLLACMPMLHAESFTANSETYTYTVQSTSTPSSGVKHTRLRFSAPNTCNVSIVEVDLTNPDVRVEAFIGQDKMFKTETLTSLYSRKTSAGRKPVVAQNGHFWSMSSQTGTSAGVHATTTCLGGAMVNGSIVTETNWAHDQWNGGPSRTGVLGITSDGKAYVDNYQSQVKVMCPAKWGTDEASNSLLVTDVNKYCIASDYMALFTPEFPSDRVMKVLNTASGQPGTVVTGTATEVYLTMNAGQKLGYNAWVTATVGKIEKNASGGTRGNYDFVLVAAPGVSQNVLASVAVGDQMKIKYNWHIVDNEATVPAFENVIAGNAIVMKDGALTGRNTDESYNSSAYARSLYGVSADNKKLIMMVVGKGSNDSEGISYGTTTARCATIMKQFGADDVLQVDGGGSAQLLVGGTMVAKSSDSGGVRAVASGIVVYSNTQLETDSYESVTPASGTANPFASSITGAFADNTLTIDYLLNAAAESVSLVVKQNGATVKTIPLAADYCTYGWHRSVPVKITDLAGGDYTWALEVTGEAKSAAQEFKSLGFNHSQGIDMDCNTESPYFGRIYVTEGRATEKTTHYSGTRGSQGLYMFNPVFEEYINWITAKYVYTGGLTIDQTVGDKTGTDFRKVRVSDDSRVFVTRQNDSGNYLYELPDVAEMQKTNAAFTQVFTGGTLNTANYFYENNGAFIAGPNVGFDLKGSGEDLKLAMLTGSTLLFAGTNSNDTRVDEYYLGSNSTWSVASSKAINALTGKYTINYAGANLCYDNMGGLWYCQYRLEPSSSQPALIYINAAGEEKYKDVTNARGGAAIRFNRDFTQIAISSTTSTFSIYDITYNADGTPVLDEQLRVSHGMGTNVNDIAWDLANNVYAVNNSGEVLKAFSLPRENNTLTIDAPSKYGFSISTVTAVENVSRDVDMPVEYYNLQGVKVDNPSKGMYVKKQGNKVTKVII